MESETLADARLWQAFAITVEDLAANHRGSLTARQQRVVTEHIKIGSFSSRLALFVCFGCAAFFLLGVPFLMREDPTLQQALPSIVGTALVFLVIVGIFVGIGLRRLQALRRAQILMVEGAIRLSTRRFRHGRWTGYYAQIGRIRFQLTTRQQYQAFTEGGRYRIYYIHYPPTHLILSLETVA